MVKGQSGQRHFFFFTLFRYFREGFNVRTDSRVLEELQEHEKKVPWREGKEVPPRDQDAGTARLSPGAALATELLEGLLLSRNAGRSRSCHLCSPPLPRPPRQPINKTSSSPLPSLPSASPWPTPRWQGVLGSVVNCLLAPWDRDGGSRGDLRRHQE